jgi:hypothetical protein
MKELYLSAPGVTRLINDRLIAALREITSALNQIGI